MRAPRGASYRFFPYFLYRWYSPKTPFKISFPDQEDFQSFTFWNARDDLKIVFHPHVWKCVAYSNVNLEYRITGATRMTSSAGYGCCFNDGAAGCASLLASTIRLLPPLILCSFFTVLATHRS
ncbi:conserved hypothetical protein [Trichinella spiralis]|uniref:hypothetical protein n=1 Tax=Trichinella spiralis TaxID=6334 RepID=UPI0001EFD898|nr:conserved hypothetical protein [Trichinella spiralis]